MNRTYEEELAMLFQRIETAAGAKTVDERCFSLHMILTQYARVRDLAPKSESRTEGEIQGAA